jgi:hypothetical protein
MLAEEHRNMRGGEGRSSSKKVKEGVVRERRVGNGVRELR